MTRGHIDNDMLMGNVQGVLAKYLDELDIISPVTDKPCIVHRSVSKCEPNQPPDSTDCRPALTWGPFTLYRNVPQITELFKAGRASLYVCFAIAHTSSTAPTLLSCNDPIVLCISCLDRSDKSKYKIVYLLPRGIAND